MSIIIGRRDEIEELEQLYRSDRAEFVAIYGRRRVGKTYLVKQVMKDRITFQHTGVSPIDQNGEKSKMKTQLESFYYSLLNHGLEGVTIPKTWFEAFYLLEQLLLKLDNGERQVIFIDELPWMDTPRSGFVSAFENFWNGWCSGRDNIMLIVCGSATSWILSHIAHSKGGLYGRLTHEIKLQPFTLKECEEYFGYQNILMSRYDIIQSYMIFGGIPYYLSYFKRGMSLSKNADNILFGKNPRLKDEFNRLFNAIFTNPDECKKIIRLLALKHNGYTREEIAQKSGLPYGGGLTTTLAALIESDFIERYNPFQETLHCERYKLTDNFCLFWLKFVEPNYSDPTFMTDNITSKIMESWRCIAFEEVCWQHITQLKRALGINGIKSKISSWSIKGNDTTDGVQIDMLIIRDDNVINLCEIKFSGDVYQIDKDEELKLRRRIATLKEHISPKQTIHLTMITTYGINNGKHSDIVQKQITMDDLFAV